MNIDKRNKIIIDCEEAVDEILHREGYVFDHKKIRDKIRELLDENLTKHNSRTNQSANHIHTFNDVRIDGNYCTTCGIPETKLIIRK